LQPDLDRRTAAIDMDMRRLVRFMAEKQNRNGPIRKTVGMSLCRLFQMSVRRGLHRADTQLDQQRAVLVVARVGRGEQRVAGEDAVRARHEAQSLTAFRHALAPRRQPHHALRHRNPRHGHGTHELDLVDLRHRRAFQHVAQHGALHRHELIDGHAFRVRHGGERVDKTDAVAARLSQPDDRRRSRR
ncbi:hypothetical protein AALP_AAs57087U000100, partial [Arabis alpina]